MALAICVDEEDVVALTSDSQRNQESPRRNEDFHVGRVVRAMTVRSRVEL
jgi:hypothetical protein